MVKFFKYIANILYPEICCGCDKHLVEYEYLLCVYCRNKLPYSEFYGCTENTLKKKFYGRIPLQYACSLLLFQKKGMAQKLIHHLKYRNNENIGVFLGLLLGDKLSKNKKMNVIQCIIPVPLHQKKEKKRGYNQLTKFGKTLAAKMCIPFRENVLIRNKIAPTQTKKDPHERWGNTVNAFTITDYDLLKNQHLLLIDDVVTTGATLEACSLELLKIENIQISIACIAHVE